MKSFICVEDFEKTAFEKLPRDALDYYRSGSDDEVTLRANREAFAELRILPRFLRDVSRINMDLELFDERLSCPIGVSPTAMHKLAHPEGELATARGTNQVGTIMTLSTLSTTCIEDLADSYPQLVKWFQLYLFTDRSESLKLIQRAEKAGFKALVLTVDAPQFAIRRRDLRNHFKIPAGFLANFDHKSSQPIHGLDYIDASLKWSDVAWLASVSSLPLLVKGLLRPEDCLMAIEHGAKGVIVSNHGGRQLDGAPATIEVLGQISRAVNGRCPIIVDGGVRTGADIFKCLALGAKMVFVGRPVLWGLACDGSDGVREVLNILKDELELAMRLTGCPSLIDITRDMVIHKLKLIAKL